jgi:hypothetical protein
MRRLVLSLAIVATAISSSAWARSERTLAYPREQAWSASVRFLRVDEQLKIVEKDAEAGYVLFELSAENKVFRGSLELITVTEDDRPSLKFVIQIQDRPSYVEGAMLTRLVRKLHVELGEPSPPPAPKPPKDEPKPKDPEPKPGEIPVLQPREP